MRVHVVSRHGRRMLCHVAPAVHLVAALNLTESRRSRLQFSKSPEMIDTKIAPGEHHDFPDRLSQFRCELFLALRGMNLQLHPKQRRSVRTTYQTKTAAQIRVQNRDPIRARSWRNAGSSSLRPHAMRGRDYCKPTSA